MRIPFEKFFEEHENDFPESAIDLFKESVLCYKVGANRSAFLMALNGFHIIIVDRLINSSVIPQTYKPQEWQEKIKELNNDDKRDEVLKGLIETENKDRKVLLISPLMIREYKNLRDIRNICAHGKSGIVDTYRIEQVWTFIQQNLASFTINGGKDYLLERIREHYDITLTPPDKDPQYLINDVINSIPEKEYYDFVVGLYNITLNLPPKGWGFNSDKKIKEFWGKLLEKPFLRLIIIEFVKKHDNDGVLDSFVLAFPNTIDEIVSDKKFARQLWSGKVFEGLPYSVSRWLMLKALVNNDIVPSNEKDKFNSDLFNKINRKVTKDFVEVLKKTNFFTLYKEKVFNFDFFKCTNLDELNRYSESIFIYLNEVEPINKETVELINEIIPKLKPGKFWRMLKEWLLDNKNLEDYKKIVSENGLENLSGELIDNSSDTEISE